MKAQVYMIPTEYNMQKSFTFEYQKLQRNFQRLLKQRTLLQVLFLTSFAMNIVLIVVAFQFALKLVMGE